MNKVGWPDFFCDQTPFEVERPPVATAGKVAVVPSFPRLSGPGRVHRWRGRGSPVTSHKEPRARFLTVTVMGWRRRRPSCLSPSRLTQFSRYFPIPSPPPILLVLGMAWKGSPWRSTDMGCGFDFMAPICRGAFINTLARSERASVLGSERPLVSYRELCTF